MFIINKGFASNTQTGSQILVNQQQIFTEEKKFLFNFFTSTNLLITF
ncbi:MAG: hypothetical protein CH6_0765 [Candidatus Kapaibacterium sp.]|nr:MAG: hypothetical protein CH6_0765 [Candidatus Kapabacteria bacterium]